MGSSINHVYMEEGEGRGLSIPQKGRSTTFKRDCMAIIWRSGRIAVMGRSRVGRPSGLHTDPKRN